jgi:hypothetical protein
MARFAASVITYRLSRGRVDGVRRRLDAIDASSPRRRSITPDAHRESAIQRGLKKRLAQLADERERRQRAAEKADEEFSLEFLNARPRRPNPLRNRLRRTAAPRRARILRARRLKRAVARGDVDA